MEQIQALGRLLMGNRPPPDIDWNAIMALAVNDHVAPLLFLNLKRLKGVPAESADVMPPIPKGVVSQLKGMYRGAVLHGMIAERELADVLKALKGAGVPVIVVKGPAVAAFYPHATLRPYGDLDLLVHKDQLGRAWEALHPLGYHGPTADVRVLEGHHHLPHLDSDDKHLTVELHWRLNSAHAGGNPPAKDIWQRAVPWSVQGQPALRLDAVDAVLHLCSHALLQHRGYLGLRPICDVAYVTWSWEREQWQTLSVRAFKYGLRKAVYIVLSQLEQVMGLEVPADVMDALRPPSLAGLPQELLSPTMLFEGKPAARPPQYLIGIWIHGSLRERIRRVFGYLFLPKEAMESRYRVPATSPRIWLTYFWRPIDLLVRHGRSVGAIFLGEPKARSTWTQLVRLEEYLSRDEADDHPE